MYGMVIVRFFGSKLPQNKTSTFVVHKILTEHYEKDMK